MSAPLMSGADKHEPPDEWEELVKADEAGDLKRVSELEVRIWVDGPYRGPDRVDPAVRDLVREMNLIALRNEADLGEERPADIPAVDRLAGIRVPTLAVAGDQDRPEIIACAGLLEGSIPHAVT